MSVAKSDIEIKNEFGTQEWHDEVRGLIDDMKSHIENLKRGGVEPTEQGELRKYYSDLKGLLKMIGDANGVFVKDNNLQLSGKSVNFVVVLPNGHTEKKQIIQTSAEISNVGEEDGE